MLVVEETVSGWTNREGSARGMCQTNKKYRIFISELEMRAVSICRGVEVMSVCGGGMPSASLSVYLSICESWSALTPIPYQWVLSAPLPWRTLALHCTKQHPAAGTCSPDIH